MGQNVLKFQAIDERHLIIQDNAPGNVGIILFKESPGFGVIRNQPSVGFEHKSNRIAEALVIVYDSNHCFFLVLAVHFISPVSRSCSVRNYAGLQKPSEDELLWLVLC